MSQANKSKSKRLWQIFFDDDNSIDDEAAASDAARTMSSMKRTLTKGVAKAAPVTSSRHGVLYKGLLEDDDTDSDPELGQSTREGRGSGLRSGDPPDLQLGAQRETILYEKRNENGKTNGVPNFQAKPFNDSEWESMEISQESSHQAPRQQLPQNGARFMIRSESDLELAVPTTKLARFCRCCACRVKLDKYSNNYACILSVGLAMVIVYIVIVLAIVYGLG